MSTANDAYRAARERATGQLRQIEELLDTHAKKQAGNSENWGYAGDLGHLNEILDNAIAFLGDKETTK